MNSGSVVRALKESQVLILGGGSLIQDATSMRNSIYYGGLMGLAQAIRTPNDGYRSRNWPL